MKLDDARILAELWMEHHGLRHWRFEFDRAVRRFGCCYALQRKITLSRTLVELNDEHEVEDVILHEIAHALAPLGEHHGPKWKEIAASIGARPERRYSRERVRVPVFVAACNGCGREIRTARRPRGSVVCAPCWRLAGKAVPLTWRPVAP